MGQEVLAQRPDRMTITNLVTASTVEMQYNPTEIEETLAVVYAHQVIPGLSHEVLQYTNTKNLAISFDLAFDALANSKDYDVDDALNARRFLQSLCYPRRGATTIRGGAPARSLFVWPNLYTLSTVITSLKIKFTRFALNGTPTAFVASLQIEEIRDFRLTAEDVLADGTQRGDGGGTAPTGGN